MSTTNVDEFEIPTDISKVRYQNYIKKNLEKENIKEIIKKYKEINIPTKEDVAQQKLEEIYTFDEVQEVVHDWENLCVYTKPLYINQYYSREHMTQDMLIGRFIIKIGIATGNLSVFKNPRKTNWWQAPHIFREWRFCTGSFNDIMAEASRKLDYSALIYYILEHLRTYNSSSPVENLQSYISSIGNELVVLESEWYPITRPLTWFSVQPGGTPFSS